MNSLKNITEDDIIRTIDAANDRIVLLTPGLTVSTSEAIARAWDRLTGSNVSVIIDTDPEVCRLGYGTIEGMKLAQKSAAKHVQLVAHQPGIRLCVLIADKETMIFSPTPHLIEAGSTEANHPNGIVLQASPPQLESELGAGPDSCASRTIGLSTIDENKIAQIEEELKENPPQKFDIARIQRVFNAKLEFVEFELEGCYISRHSVQIPPELIGLAQKDPATQNKLRSTFRLIEKGDESDSKGKISEKKLTTERKRITSKFLVPLKGHGVVILRSNKDDFLKEIEALKEMVKNFQDGLESKLEEIYAQNADRLTKALLPSVIENPPEAWTSFLGGAPKPDEIMATLHAKLLESFGKPENLIKAMNVSIKFKGVTYESLKNDDFRDKAQESFPKLQIHEEFDAARTQQPDLFPSN